MRSRTLNTVIARPQMKATCTHHWLIETAVGVTSRGVCKLCGAEKEFSNVIDESAPKNDIASLIEAIDFGDDEDGGEEDSEESAVLQVSLSK